LREWVVQDEIDAGEAPGTSTKEAARVQALEQEVRELRRANAILKYALLRGGARPPTEVMVRYIDPHPRRVRGRADLQGLAGRPVHVLLRQVLAAVGPGGLRTPYAS
jgi:hypothetical protein